MRLRPTLLPALLSLMASASAETAADTRYAAIGALGELNGVATSTRCGA